MTMDDNPDEFGKKTTPLERAKQLGISRQIFEAMNRLEPMPDWMFWELSNIAHKNGMRLEDLMGGVSQRPATPPDSGDGGGE